VGREVGEFGRASRAAGVVMEDARPDVGDGATLEQVLRHAYDDPKLCELPPTVRGSLSA